MRVRREYLLVCFSDIEHNHFHLYCSPLSGLFVSDSSLEGSLAKGPRKWGYDGRERAPEGDRVQGRLAWKLTGTRQAQKVTGKQGRGLERRNERSRKATKMPKSNSQFNDLSETRVQLPLLKHGPQK